MKTNILIFGILLICLPNILKSQCCTAGNPFTSGLNFSHCNENTLGVSLFYQHSYSNEYYKNSKKTDFKYIDNLYYNFTSIMLNYQLLSNLKITADIGYFFDKTQNFDFGINQKFKRIAQGISDMAVGTQYSFDLYDNYQTTIIPGIKITLPVGQFDQMDGAVVLPIDIQPSSGNLKYELGLSLIKTLTNKFTIISANTAEFPQRIQTERTNYKYGNLYNISLTGIYKFFDEMSMLLQIRGQLREKSSDNNYKFINSTGGYYLFVNPQISFNLYDDLSLNLQYEIPVYKNVNGIQLTNNYTFGIRISKIINFRNTNQLNFHVLNPDTSLKFKKIQCQGMCEMCKERIENTVKEFKNIQFADWDIETKILSLGYNSEPDFDAITKAIALVGHDNENYKAPDEVYKKLPACCKYRK